MSVSRDWKITIELEGEWSEQSIEDLNAAMHGWWYYADFFSEITFSAPGQTVSAEDSGYFDFDELVDLSANGDDKNSLEKRNGFDPAVHQRLLDSMKAGKSAIKFSVDEENECDMGYWYTLNYKVTSDGKRFVVEEDFDVGDFLVTGKLCGEWSEDTIKMLNELMDFLDENEDAREGYQVRGVHFSASEKESAPVEMGEIAQWQGGVFGYVMADGISDSGVSDDLPIYQTLLDEMKAKDLRILFHVSGNGYTMDLIAGQEYVEYMMYSDGEALVFSEQGGDGEIYRTV